MLAAIAAAGANTASRRRRAPRGRSPVLRDWREARCGRVHLRDVCRRRDDDAGAARGFRARQGEGDRGARGEPGQPKIANRMDADPRWRLRGRSARFHRGLHVAAPPGRQPRADQVPVVLGEAAGWVAHRGLQTQSRRRGERSSRSDAAALPAQLVATTTDAAVIERYRDSLDKTERAFSDDAQKIGIGPAFAKWGSADAINLGPATEPRVTVGAAAIGRSIGGDGPPAGSPVTWAPDRVIIASSGDLGVTIGFLRRNTPPAAGQPATIPFITVWRRASPSDPWRYVAE